MDTDFGYRHWRRIAACFALVRSDAGTLRNNAVASSTCASAAAAAAVATAGWAMVPIFCAQHGKAVTVATRASGVVCAPMMVSRIPGCLEDGRSRQNGTTEMETTSKSARHVKMCHFLSHVGVSALSRVPTIHVNGVHMHDCR
jgi:hypothetical protein